MSRALITRRLAATGFFVMLSGALGCGLGDTRVGARAKTASSAAIDTPGWPEPQAVSCTGSVEPAAGIVTVAAPSVAGRMPIVARLLVQEGDTVRQGDTLAELDTMAELRAAAAQAEARVQVAQRRIAQLKAGPRPGDLQAAAAQIARLEADLAAAQAQSARSEELAKQDYVPRVQAEAARLKFVEARLLLQEMQQRQRGLTEIRGADLALAEAELRAAQADHDRAELTLSSTRVRAPGNGRVTRILARPGEAVGLPGLLEIASDGPIVVMAEIYETDAWRVKPGQRAKVTADSLKGEISGSVAWISPRVEPSPAPGLDPGRFAESRVYRARIVLDHSGELGGRIHARVNVRIGL